ncbi:MAG: WbqC family protein, partial [Patescibacteria group bacterium]
YCGGTAVAAYMDEELFQKNGISVTVQDWKCRDYRQNFARIPFLPNLSIIDLLMNVSYKEALGILNT